MSEVDGKDNLETETSSESLSRSDLEHSLVVPVVREELSVEKRIVTTGTVRIRKVIHQKEHLVDEPVKANNIEVEWVAVNRIVEGPIPVRQEGDTSIYSVVEEVVVVTKQFVLKEELRITNRISESHDRQLVTLRAEELVVDREAMLNNKI